MRDAVKAKKPSAGATTNSTHKNHPKSKLASKMFQHSFPGAGADEVVEYLNLPVESSSIDPLQWWQVYVPQLPVLSSIVKDALSIPGSSVSVERVFNVGRDAIGIRRSALNHEIKSGLMFGNHYLK
jgi:hypothetical protein